MAIWINFLSNMPASAQAPSTQSDSSILKAYPYPAGNIEAVADYLKKEFQGQSEVRITADLRTAQIIVFAPTNVQAQIAERLTRAQISALGPPERAGSVYTPPSPSDSRSNRTVSIPLQHINGQQLEESLIRMMGNRFSTIAPAEQGAKSFQLTLPGGSVVRVDILPQLNRANVYGAGTALESFARLIQTLDTPARSADESTQLVSLNKSAIPAARRAAEAIHTAGSEGSTKSPVVAKPIEQSKEASKPPPMILAQNDGNFQGGPPPNSNTPAQGEQGAGAGEIGQLGPVQVEVLEGLDVLIVRGHRRDVEQVMNVIKQIEQISAVTEPAVEVYKLKYIDCQALADLIKPLYEEVYSIRQGSVSITALVNPNALLLIGRKENVKTALDLAERLDQPVAPDTQFRVFRLQHTSASSAEATVTEFYTDRGGLGTRVKVSADTRSNSLIIQASPRDMAETAELIARLDTPTSETVNELRIIVLENTMADDLASIIQDAISGQTATTAPRSQPSAPTGGQPGGQQGQSQRSSSAGRSSTSSSTTSDQRSAVLRFLTVDTKGQKLLKSGILSDVKVTADTQANALVVSAPAESMELIVALIRQLDRLPSAVAEVKVFTIVNGDASALTTMLQSLFGGRQGQQGAVGQQGLQAVTLEGTGSLVPIRLAVDTRTNSIIASGAAGDLNVVEAILLRLDESDVRNRKNHVYRLKNAPAQNVSQAINQFLTNVRQMQQLTPGIISPFEQIEQEVIVVPEVVSNSLIVSATPRFFDEIQKIVEQLDARPPMVMIQVLIAQVTLTDNEEFGIELGLQDGLLFDRSAALTTTTTGTTLNPGFAFNNQSLGNSATGPSGNSSLNNANQVGTQGLSNFALGRTNSNLGYGGFVLSASSESVSVLLRALKQNQRVEVLSRPQVMTLDNQPAFIMVGQAVPQITGTTSTSVGQTNSISMTNVGLIMNVTPRISPDGLVVMEIDAVKSDLGPIEQGIPVSALNGQIIRSPIINTTQAQTTVSALDGQTVVLGGLIQKSKTDFHRKVPWVGDLPVVGRLFRYDGVTNERDELLIIMTPHIVKNESDADKIKQIEAARMNWCLADVIAMTGDDSLRRRCGEWSDNETQVIYPDLDPRALKPYPSDGKPFGVETVPTPPPLPDSGMNTAPGNGPVIKPATPTAPARKDVEGASGLPPEPPHIQSVTNTMAPQSGPPAVGAVGYFNGNCQNQSQVPVPLPSVQSATYERSPESTTRPGQPNPYPPSSNGSNNVVPTMYDAPIKYPTTQTPFYR
jgi:general secretion pathway protein D